MAAATAAQEGSGEEHHDSSSRRGAKYLSEKFGEWWGLGADSDGAVPHSGDDGERLRPITNFNGFEARTRMRATSVNPATALVAVMRVMSPQRPKRLRELGSTIETRQLQLNALAQRPRRVIVAETSRGSCSCCRTISRTLFQSTGTPSTYEDVRDKVKGLVCNRLGPMDLGFVQEEEYWLQAEDDSWMLGADIGHAIVPKIVLRPSDRQELRKRRLQRRQYFLLCTGPVEGWKKGQATNKTNDQSGSRPLMCHPNI